MSALGRPALIEPSWLRVVQGQVESLQFGVVQVVVHDRRVVQIERTEKLRFTESELKPVGNADAAAEGASALAWGKTEP